VSKCGIKKALICLNKVQQIISPKILPRFATLHESIKLFDGRQMLLLSNSAITKSVGVNHLNRVFVPIFDWFPFAYCLFYY
jgi:hypothetical protein